MLPHRAPERPSTPTPGREGHLGLLLRSGWSLAGGHSLWGHLHRCWMGVYTDSVTAGSMEPWRTEVISRMSPQSLKHLQAGGILICLNLQTPWCRAAFLLLLGVEDTEANLTEPSAHRRLGTLQHVTSCRRPRVGPHREAPQTCLLSLGHPGASRVRGAGPPPRPTVTPICLFGGTLPSASLRLDKGALASLGQSRNLAAFALGVGLQAARAARGAPGKE